VVKLAVSRSTPAKTHRFQIISDRYGTRRGVNGLTFGDLLEELDVLATCAKGGELVEFGRVGPDTDTNT